MNAAAIIQARMGASRLPGKMLKKIEDKTVLEHVISRAIRSDLIERVIVATTDHAEDLKIVEIAERTGVSTFRGSEDDVLDRFFQTANHFKCEHIVRITGDCPVIDPDVIDRVVLTYFNEKVDYCSNALEPTYPDGQDVEVFSYEALKRSWEEAKLGSEREHVTPYMRVRENGFKIKSLKNHTDYANKRWTLDQKEDLEFLKLLYEGLYSDNPFFGMRDILEFLEKNPELEGVNNSIQRNEGYLKSLEKDNKAGE